MREGMGSEGRKRILVVDDEPGVRESLRLLLKGDFDVSIAGDGGSAISVLDQFQPDLILLDVLMPELDGLETLRALRSRGASTPVIMLTATNTVKTAVQAMKLGAFDYLNKPFEIEELTSVIVRALDQAPSEASVPESRTDSRRMELPEGDFGPMVGTSGPMQELFFKISQVAERDATVLISGESGTGKELIARRIHAMSARASGPFVAINCAAIPETLIESELFGHEKGAFTHAIEKRIGHCELADRGTLFLDEIGELSLAVQVKLLRFLQEQEFHRVGRSKAIRVDARIITATNKSLETLVAEQRFRQDLFYRINVINLQIPPLRDRFEDIPRLIDHFVKKLQPLYQTRTLNFSDDALRAMVAYAWPGNVRELENVVESLMALAPSDEIALSDLPAKVRNPDNREPLRAALAERGMNFQEAERAFETEMIRKALRKTGYVQTRAAELLGISRRILKYKMDKLGIADSEESPSAAGGVEQS